MLATAVIKDKTNQLPSRSDYPFFFSLRVRYSEIDAQAVVYNSHYVTYFDLAITEYLRHIDFDYTVEKMRQTGKDFHTVRVIVDYKRPAFYLDCPTKVLSPHGGEAE